MKCPADETELKMTERQGIEIDYCPQCRGVWLDRGELDKIIDRASPPSAQPQQTPEAYVRPTPAAPQRVPDQRGYQDDDRDYAERRYRDDHRHYDNDYYRKRKKRSGILGELFDFD